MKYRTERARQIKIEEKMLYEKIQKLEEENRELFRTYCDMEGKYGKTIYPEWAQGHGMRGYDYEYSSNEIKEKEKQEREDFLKNSNYYTNKKLINEYMQKSSELVREFSFEQYGMSFERKILVDNVHLYEKELKEIQEELESAKQKLKEYDEREGK